MLARNMKDEPEDEIFVAPSAPYEVGNVEGGGGGDVTWTDSNNKQSTVGTATEDDNEQNSNYIFDNDEGQADDEDDDEDEDGTNNDVEEPSSFGGNKNGLGVPPASMVPPTVHKGKKMALIIGLSCCCAILVGVVAASMIYVFVVDDGDDGNKNSAGGGGSSGGDGGGEGGSSVNGVAGGRTCALASPIEFGSTSAPVGSPQTLQIRGDTRLGGSTPSTTACGLSATAGPGVFYKLEGVTGQVRMSLCPTKFDQNRKNGFNDINVMRVGVVTGNCGGDDQFDSNREVQCVTTQAWSSVNFCRPESSLLSWTALASETYYIYVQDYDSLDETPGGSFDLTITKEGVTNAVDPVQSLGDFEGTISDDTMGYRVAMSADGSIVATTSGGISRQGSVRLFRRTSAGTYQQEKSLLPTASAVNELQFGWHIAMSSNGKRLVVNSRTTVQVFDIVSDVSNLNQELEFETQQEFDLNVLQYEVDSVAISDNGDVIALNHFSQGLVRFYHWDDGLMRWTTRVNDIVLSGVGALPNLVSYDRTVALSNGRDRVALVEKDQVARLYVVDDIDSTGLSIAEWRLVLSIPQVTAVNLNGDCLVVGLKQEVMVWCHDRETSSTEQWGETLVLPNDDARSNSTSTNGTVVHSVSLSDDGNVLVVGTPFYSPSNTTQGAGRVAVYQKKDQQWEVVEQVISDSEGDQFGYVTSHDDAAGS